MFNKCNGKTINYMILIFKTIIIKWQLIPFNQRLQEIIINNN